MQTSHAVLVASAVGVAHIWFAHRRHQQRLVLDAAKMHQHLLADIATDLGQLTAWTPHDLSEEEYRALVNYNRLISFLSAKYRVGLLDKAALRVQARALMTHASCRAYWARFGAFREAEAMDDSTDRSFNRIFDDEYTAVADATESVAA
ncbi:DUF6082 family protein [Streptomyces nodosus]|uniref:DUF6082 family protein n=1 Tax=Streptomyces nodosus TaxID=40318 RepID=UPI0038221DA3